MSQTIEFPFSYPYQVGEHGSGHLFRPLITVRLIYGKRSSRIPSLLDTGADISAFNAVWASRLGIDLTTLPTRELSGIGKAIGYQCIVQLKFGPLPDPVRCEVLFVEDLRLGRATGFLGRMGAFENLIIAFNETDREVYMRLGHV